VAMKADCVGFVREPKAISAQIDFCSSEFVVFDSLPTELIT